jgi:hypothetical protein
VNTCPAIVMVPLRGAPVAFASTVNSTVPAPDPLPPFVTVTQGTLLTAVHAQPPPVVTVTDPDPPATGTACVEGAIETVHPASWLTDTVLPAMVAVPLRAGPVFDWMSSWTVPLPDPLAPMAIAIHAALLTAVHEHSAAVVTLTVCDPPAAGSPIVSGATTGLHPPSCVTVNVCPAAVIVPLRAPPVLAAAVNCTVPGPVPLPPDVMEIQEAFAVAVHAHAPVAFTVNDPDPPPDGTLWPPGEIENVQPPACTTVDVWPAIVTVPRRSASAFAPITSCTVPLPDPAPPEEMPIHGTLLPAFHEQPAGAVTPTDAFPPPLPTSWLAGEIENEQPPSCRTVNVFPPALIVPVRCGPGLAAAAKRTVPLPLPVAPAVMLSHGALLAAVQPHPAAVRTSKAPLPPPAGAVADDEESEIEQSAPWFTVNVRPAMVSVPDRAGPLVAATL